MIEPGNIVTVRPNYRTSGGTSLYATAVSDTYDPISTFSFGLVISTCIERGGLGDGTHWAYVLGSDSGTLGWTCIEHLDRVNP